MDVDTFNEFADLALKGSGQHIPPAKSYLVEARLSPLIRREGFSSADELAACLKARPNKMLEAEIIAALTTKTTRFFYEREALEFIVEQVLPARQEAGATRLRVLCAGGSSGQEAYSLAMMIDETPNTVFADTPIDIVSVDICEETTQRARAGHYGHFEVQRGLAIQRLLKYFKRQEDGGWQISDDMRLQIGFRVHNLLQPVDGLGEFDAVLCRGVLSNMALPVRSHVANNLIASVKQGGALILGADEKLPVISDEFSAVDALRHAFVRTPNENEAVAA